MTCNIFRIAESNLWIYLNLTRLIKSHLIMLDTLNFSSDTLTDLTDGFGAFSDGAQWKASMFIDYGTIIELIVIMMVPVLIVLVVMLFQYLSRRAKYRLAEKAVEAGVEVDITTLLNTKKRKSAKKSLMRRIVWGGLLTVAGLALILFEAISDESADADDFVISAIILAIGVGLVLSFVFGRKLLAHNIELENKEEEIEFRRRHGQSGAKGNAGETTESAQEDHNPENEEK